MGLLLNAGNRKDYLRAIDRLDIQVGDHVLELGFGGGVSLPWLLKRGAVVTGVEPAVAMRARAFRKHAWPLAEGKLRVIDGCAESLPDGPFARALSLNTAYFWDDVPKAMSELRRTVTERVVLGISPTDHLGDLGFRESGFRVEEPEWYADQLRAAGFNVTLEPAPSGYAVAFVIGTPQ